MGSRTLIAGGQPTGVTAIGSGIIDSSANDQVTFARHRGLVAGWLLLCCALVMAIVVVGGATRLTRSGLSIVEWQPISGVLPPIGEPAWKEVFGKYQLTPEFRLVNHAMTLD